MGVISSSHVTPEPMEIFDYEIPEDILVEILSFVPAHDLLNCCAVVCKLWEQLISGHGIWKRKCERGGRIIPSYNFQVLPKNFYRKIYLRNSYGRNLLKNPYGEDSFNVWHISRSGGDGWKVENPPNGADAVPDEVGTTYCFATSYGECMKYQVIDLLEEGVNEEILDNLRPSLTVGEWHAARFDCGCDYELEVSLLDSNHSVIKQKKFEHKTEQWQGKSWQKVSYTFEDYPKGLRYINFMHMGKDTQFWAGHFGSKMTGAFVTFKSS